MDNESFFDRSVKLMRGVTTGSVIEQSVFMQSIAILSRNAWQSGWHHGGGSLSYRLRREEVAKCRSSFSANSGDWTPFGVRAHDLQNEFFVITGEDAGFETLAYDLSSELGIIEINRTGDFWRCVWGFERTGCPTRELLTHFMAHAVRMRVTSGLQRVVYHSYPQDLDVLVALESGKQKLFSELPEKVGLLSPGSEIETPDTSELAQKSAELFESYSTIALPQDGILCTADSSDAAFDIMLSLETSATALRKKGYMES